MLKVTINRIHRRGGFHYRFTGIFILPALIIVSAIVNDLSNNHFNLMGFGQIRRFPSREQPVDDFGRNA
jgi:hypothetical protein